MDYNNRRHQIDRMDYNNRRHQIDRMDYNNRRQVINGLIEIVNSNRIWTE